MSEHRVCAPIDGIPTHGEVALRRAVAEETRASVTVPYEGPYAAYVMRPFNFPIASRFSDGTFGVHYSADRFDVAIAEHGFHLARALMDARMPAIHMRRAYLTLEFNADLPEIEPRAELLRADDYTASQQYGSDRRRMGDPGVRYPSVRKAGGACAGLFHPILATDVYLLTDSLSCRWSGSALRFD